MSREAGTMRGRLRQTELWLRYNFPCRSRVRVRFVKTLNSGADHGWTRPKKRWLQITLELGKCEQCATDKLCHEWAHAVTYSLGERRHHGAQWGYLYGRITDAWDEKGVNAFSPRPWR